MNVLNFLYNRLFPVIVRIRVGMVNGSLPLEPLSIEWEFDSHRTFLSGILSQQKLFFRNTILQCNIWSHGLTLYCPGNVYVVTRSLENELLEHQ